MRLWREHNDANALSFAPRFVSVADAVTLTEMWLETPFSGEARHARRIGRIEEEAAR